MTLKLKEEFIIVFLMDNTWNFCIALELLMLASNTKKEICGGFK
jgi:hypothetical protein